VGLATSGKPFMAGYGIGWKIRITSPPSVRRFSFDHLGSRPPSLTRFRRSANLAEKLQNVMAVTEAPSKFWQETQIKRGARS
jgi:hypothetical protein